MRRLSLVIGLLVCGLLAIAARAETFKLNNGDTITGELLATSANDQGVQIKVGEGDYQRVPWTSFSQEDLKKFRQTKKLEPLVEPFIEITQEEKIQKTEVPTKPPPRLSRPAAQSLFGALLSSGVGLSIVLLLYAANIYAGYEIAIFRAQSVPLVCGISAVLPIVGPIIYLSMPTRMQAGQPAWDVPAEGSPEAAAAAAAAAGSSAADAVNPMQAEGAAHPTALKMHTEEPEAKPEQTEAVVYQRGQYTFNRRFIETKFAGFFGVVRRDVEKDLVLVVKSARGHYIGQRIARIASNDMHLQVMRGHASEEVMIPFQEIQEIRVQHKDAK